MPAQQANTHSHPNTCSRVRGKDTNRKRERERERKGQHTIAMKENLLMLIYLNTYVCVRVGENATTTIATKLV